MKSSRFYTMLCVLGMLFSALSAVFADDATVTYDEATHTYSGYGNINTAKTFTANTFFDIADGKAINTAAVSPIFSGGTGITVVKTGAGTLNFNKSSALLGTFRILDGTVSLNAGNGGKGTIGQNCTIEVSGSHSQLICNSGDTLGYDNFHENVLFLTLSDGAKLIYKGNNHQTNCAATTLSNASMVMYPNTTMDVNRFSHFGNTVTSSADTQNLISVQNIKIRGAANFNVEANSLLEITSNFVDSCSANIVKNGTGKMILSGENAYKTATQINAGTLTFDKVASMGATSGITVASGATLGFGANVFSKESGTFPTMTFQGNNGLEVKINDKSTFTSLDWSNFNMVNPANITTLYVDLSDWTDHMESYDIITGLNGQLQNLAQVVALQPGWIEGISLSYANGTYTLGVVGLPEPASWTLLVLGIGLLLRKRVRR